MKILIIEDDRVLVATLKDMLENEGYTVDFHHSISDIEDYITLNTYNLIILDIMLEDMDGFIFLRMVRNEIHTPVIILTARDRKEDILNGFDLGANDYITKPFDTDILLARIKSHVHGESIKEIQYRDTVFNLGTGIIVTAQGAINLTSTELEIITYLAKNVGQILAKEQILNSISTEKDATEKTVISHIYNM